ncbi:unnamed protein product [Caenorhabditis angaria]|uniref:Uncharacterized protein n=1 Tax=Caenorhabditis angaria TaxID=860376 RepID=A0A9P1IDM0_9PELO|nr:unnamed protein product [Caenorhabditis angaria]
MKLLIFCLVVPLLAFIRDEEAESCGEQVHNTAFYLDSTTTVKELAQVYTNPYTRTNYECNPGTKTFSHEKLLKAFVPNPSPNATRSVVENTNFNFTLFDVKSRRETSHSEMYKFTFQTIYELATHQITIEYMIAMKDKKCHLLSETWTCLTSAQHIEQLFDEMRRDMGLL